MSTATEQPTIIRDMPIGSAGRRSRLLMVTPDREQHRFVYYRGTNANARAAVGGCDAELLRELFDRRQDVERRQGVSSDLARAIGLALDLPSGDTEIGRIVAYLESTT